MMMVQWLKNCLPKGVKHTMKQLGRSLLETSRYRRNRPRGAVETGSHLIFVCKGNICRSAFAEYYFKKLAPEGAFRVESCGIDVDQGVYSPPEAVRVAKTFGVDLEGHRSKGLDACNVDDATLILAMEYPQYCDLKQRFPNKKDNIRLLREFIPGAEGLFCNIYDPYGWDEKAFSHCFRQVVAAVDQLAGSQGPMKG